MSRIGTLTKGFGLAAMLMGGALAGSAWADDSGFFTRQTFDLVMRWVNFLILAAVVFKYSPNPILQFLDNQKATVAQEIEKLALQKHQIETRVTDAQQLLLDNQESLEKIKERIIAEGQARKDQIINEAQRDARILLETVKLKIEGQMLTMYDNLKAELIDMSADLALSRLPSFITAEDQSRLIKRWFDSQEVQIQVFE